MIKTLILVLLMAGCNGLVKSDEMQEDKEMDDIKINSAELNYLALGDSYTIGESVAEEKRFPYQLIHSEFMPSQEVGQLKIIAQTGWTTKDLLLAMDKENLTAGQFDFITLLIGVNNQYQGKPFQQYEEEFNELMDRAISLMEGNSSKVIVVSIPDYSVTPFASSSDTDKISMELKQYNDYNKKIAEERGAHYVYITDLTQNAKNDPSLLADDGLHPSGKSYGQWVERIIPKVNQILQN